MSSQAAEGIETKWVEDLLEENGDLKIAADLDEKRYEVVEEGPLEVVDSRLAGTERNSSFSFPGGYDEMVEVLQKFEEGRYWARELIGGGVEIYFAGQDDPFITSDSPFYLNG